jgi:hypothetical protein
MAVEYVVNISDRVKVLQTAKLKNGTDVTNYVSAVVCSMTATETVGDKTYTAGTDGWVSLTAPADKEGDYDVYANISSRPAWVTAAANAWASDELKANLAAQIEGQKTAPTDGQAVWAS